MIELILEWYVQYTKPCSIKCLNILQICLNVKPELPQEIRENLLSKYQKRKLDVSRRGLAYKDAVLYNELNTNITNAPTIELFKTRYMASLFSYDKQTEHMVEAGIVIILV